MRSAGCRAAAEAEQFARLHPGLAASPIDDGWATSLRDAVGADVVVLSPASIEASSLPRTRLSWQRAGDVPASAESEPLDLTLTGERFQAVGAALQPEGPRRVIILQSATRPWRPSEVLGFWGSGVLGCSGSEVLDPRALHLGELAAQRRNLLAESRFRRLPPRAHLA